MPDPLRHHRHRQALGPGGLAPAGVGAARILVGGGLLVVVAILARGLQTLARLPRWPVLIGAGAVATDQLSFFAAVSDTGVALGTIVALGSAPAMAGAIESAVERRAPERSWAMATALALRGRDDARDGRRRGGDLAARRPARARRRRVVRGLHARRQADADRRPRDRDRDGGRVGLGAVLLLPVLAITGAGWRRSPAAPALAIFLGVVPTAAAYLVFARGLRRISAAETATLTLAEPLTAALLGVIVLSERMSAPAALGAVLILGGLLVRRPRGPPERYRRGVTRSRDSPPRCARDPLRQRPRASAWSSRT